MSDSHCERRGARDQPCPPNLDMTAALALKQALETALTDGAGVDDRQRGGTAREQPGLQVLAAAVKSFA